MLTKILQQNDSTVQNEIAVVSWLVIEFGASRRQFLDDFEL